MRGRDGGRETGGCITYVGMLVISSIGLDCSLTGPTSPMAAKLTQIVPSVPRPLHSVSSARLQSRNRGPLHVAVLKYLDSPQQVWLNPCLCTKQERYSEGYGTVLDSGTTFTYLPADVFRIFVEFVTRFALDQGLRSTKGPDPKVIHHILWVVDPFLCAEKPTCAWCLEGGCLVHSDHAFQWWCMRVQACMNPCMGCICGGCSLKCASRKAADHPIPSHAALAIACLASFSHPQVPDSKSAPPSNPLLTTHAPAWVRTHTLLRAAAAVPRHLLWRGPCS